MSEKPRIGVKTTEKTEKSAECCTPCHTEVYQIIRTIGNPASDPTAVNVDAVNELLGNLMSEGWVLKFVIPMGVVPGGAIIYYLLVR